MTAANIMTSAKEMADELFFEPVLGFRCLPSADPSCEIGQVMENSMDWQDDEPTGIELRGACALSFEMPLNEAIKTLKSYHGDDASIYIIAGDSSSKGQDENELIISNAHVVGILK